MQRVLVRAARGMQLRQRRERAAGARPRAAADPGPRTARATPSAKRTVPRRWRTQYSGSVASAVADPGAGQVRDERDLRRREPQAAQEGAPLGQDRIEHRRVRGDLDAHAPRSRSRARRARRSSALDRGDRARGDAQLGRVDRGERELAAEQRRDLLRRQRDREHRARRHALEEPPAQRHERQRVVEREHAGQTRGRVLAHAVADQRGRLDAPRAPELRERVLDEEERGQLQRGALEALRRLLDRAPAAGTAARGSPRGARARAARGTRRRARRYTGSLS